MSILWGALKAAELQLNTTGDVLLDKHVLRESQLYNFMVSVLEPAAVEHTAQESICAALLSAAWRQPQPV